MSSFRRVRTFSLRLLRGLVVLAALILVLLGLAIAALETGWAKNQLRALVVRQANQYLTATLDIGRLEGSLFRGLELGDVTLSRDGRPIVAIDEVGLSYSLRELWEGGTVIRRLVVRRPRIVAAREADGRWNLGGLVRRDARQQERAGPRRAIQIQDIDVVDASVSLRDPMKFGAANVPTEFTSLNLSMSFAYAPVRWVLDFENASFVGRAPDLTVNRLSGVMGRSAEGWFFETFAVETPRSAFTFSGDVLVGDKPSVLDLEVRADRFAFQEWSGIVPGLRNIAVEAAFDTALEGPLTALDTQLSLSGTGGSISGRVTLNTRVPGWHGTGEVDVAHIDLARWLNRSDRPSDVTGRLAFDFDLDLGRRFPRGRFVFQGDRTMYMGYAAERLRAEGRLIVGRAVLERLSAVAYGANITSSSGSIGLENPYPYHFRGAMSRLDLRRLPEAVPVPHVESVLAFDYDAVGSFSRPFITGSARFAASEFLGASIADGTVGEIDTAVSPLRYAGEGEIEGVDLGRFARELDIGWLQDPRYAGSVSGRFRVEGYGGDERGRSIAADGRFTRAELFDGIISDAAVTLQIADGTLSSSFNGALAHVDPAIAFGDPRLAAALNGTLDVKATIRELLIRPPMLADYAIDGRMALSPSTVRDLEIDAATMEGVLADEQLTVAGLDLAGPALKATGSGLVAFNDRNASDFQYQITGADLAALRPVIGRDASGQAVAMGRVVGPPSATRIVGEGTISELDAFGIQALTMIGAYDLTLPSSREVDNGPSGAALEGARASEIPEGQFNGRATFLTLFGESMQEATGTIGLAADKVDFDVAVTQAPGRTGQIAGIIGLHPGRQRIDLLNATITLGSTPWRLVVADAPPVVTWNDAGLTITPTTFATGHEDDQQVRVEGTWRDDGNGALRVRARNAFLETLQSSGDRPPRFGGVLDLDAVVSGTRTLPLVRGTLTVSDGRIERVTYERLTGRVDYAKRMFEIDVRLDQAPGTWLTATGTVPAALFDRDLPEAPIDVAISSSTIDLGLLAGITDVVTNSTGQIQIDVRAIGTSGDPHFEGLVDVEGAGFVVAATGARYQNGRAFVRLSSDRLDVESLYLEDQEGQAMEVRGSLGTHELKVGDLNLDVTAQRFEVLRNQYGRLDIDAMLMVRGRFEEPRLTGHITLNGENLDVDEILTRTLFQPYSTQSVSFTPIDAIAAVNPWERLGLDITLRVNRALRLIGSDIQVSPGTPIGLGDINLRVGGDLYLYKDPGQPLYPSGSLDQVSGRYVFQGRRFEIDEAASSINFVGDLDPQLWVEVTREISGVETRVVLSGSLRDPALRLTSNPPLDESDILSLIVFNTTPNALSAIQQEELAVRAATLAAGFVAQPLVEAVQNELGLEILEIETASDPGASPRLTIGQEIAPGLIARFSRQFGQDPWNQATIEYYLSRLFRIRATFSDAQSVTARSTFRRIERAGIDLLLFFSF